MRSLKNIVESLENRRFSWQSFIATFYLVTLLRNYLETFSDTGGSYLPVHPLDFFVHYPLFYLVTFLAWVLVLSLFTGESVHRISVILLHFLPLILLAPLLDLALHASNGANISYVFAPPAELVHRYLSFGGAYHGSGASPGIRLELAVIFLLVAIYLYIKTGNGWKTIAGTIICYSITFLLGALPSVAAACYGADFPLRSLFVGDVILFHYYGFSAKIVLLFVPVLLIELAWMMYKLNPQKARAVLTNMRAERAAHYLAMLAIGMGIGVEKAPAVEITECLFTVLILAAAGLSVLLAWGAAVFLNDLQDRDLDRLANPDRPLVAGVLNNAEMKAVGWFMAVAALVLAVIVRYAFFLVILLALGLSYLYSVPPFRLKRIPGVATFVLALCAALVCLGGYVLFSPTTGFAGFPFRILLTILVVFTLALTFKDIKDAVGDRRARVRTLVTLLPFRRGKRLTGLAVGISYPVAVLLLKVWWLLPPALLWGMFSFHRICRTDYRERPIFWAYYLFLALLIIAVYPHLNQM